MHVSHESDEADQPFIRNPRAESLMTEDSSAAIAEEPSVSETVNDSQMEEEGSVSGDTPATVKSAPRRPTSRIGATGKGVKKTTNKKKANKNSKMLLTTN